MDKLQQLREKYRALTEEIRSLNTAGKVDEATVKLEERKKLQQQIDIEVELAEEEKRDLEAQKRKKEEEGRAKGSGKEKTVDEFRSVIKYAMGGEDRKNMTEEERAVIKTTDNAAVIPEEFTKEIIKLQKGYGSLKDLCDVRPVTKNEGTVPVVDLEQNEMKDVLEGDDIADGSLVTENIKYTCSKIGLVHKLASELIDDAEVEIEGLIKENYPIIATRKENVRILNVLKSNAEDLSSLVTEEKLVEDVIAESLDKAIPAVKSGQITLTTPDGYAYLNNKKDANGRALNLITTINGIEYFHNYPIKTIDPALVTLTEGKKMIFFIANMKEAVLITDRKKLTVAISGSDAGFSNDTKLTRALERIGIQKKIIRSIRKIEA